MDRLLLAMILLAPVGAQTLEGLRAEYRGKIEAQEPGLSAADVRRQADVLIGVRLEREARRWTPQRAIQAERAAAAGDAAARFALAAYYIREPHQDAARWRRHAVWLIDHLADSALMTLPELTPWRWLPPQVVAAWRRQLDLPPRDADVSGNAAWVMSRDDPEQATRLLLKAELLQPKRALWHDELGSLYALRFRKASGRARQSLAAKALDEYESAQRLGPSLHGSRLPELVEAARAAGNARRLRRYERQLRRRGYS